MYCNPSSSQLRFINRAKIKTPSARDLVRISGDSRYTSNIMRIIKSRMPGLRHTYRKHLKRNHKLSGTIILKITLAANGNIIAISVDCSTTDDTDFDNAIKAKVKRWKWKKTETEKTTFTVPFTFYE